MRVLVDLPAETIGHSDLYVIGFVTLEATLVVEPDPEVVAANVVGNVYLGRELTVLPASTEKVVSDGQDLFDSAAHVYLLGLVEQCNYKAPAVKGKA